MPKTRNTETAQPTPAAVITHSLVRIQGAQSGDINIYHAGSETARMTLTFGGILMTFWSAEAAQSVLESFAAARPLLASLMRQSLLQPTRRWNPSPSRRLRWIGLAARRTRSWPVKN